MIAPGAAERFMASNWLSEMDAKARRAVLGVLEEHRAKPGTVLLEPGRPNDRIGFLIEGTVKVTIDAAPGRSEELITIQAPSMFGLTTFFRASPPTFTARATTPVWYLTLDRAAHERLRHENPRAGEQLALAAVHILADRIDVLDRKISDELAEHPDDHPKVTEWSTFRARLLEDSSL
jgi:CRP/FNR family cyclic AMP-dependent transcriptional regulator